MSDEPQIQSGFSAEDLAKIADMQKLLAAQPTIPTATSVSQGVVLPKPSLSSPAVVAPGTKMPSSSEIAAAQALLAKASAPIRPSDIAGVRAVAHANHVAEAPSADVTDASGKPERLTLGSQLGDVIKAVNSLIDRG